MPFVLLLLVALVFLQHRWPMPPQILSLPGSAAIIVSLGMLLAVVVAWLLARKTRHRLQHAPNDYHIIAKLFVRWRRQHLFGFLGFFLVALYLAGWGWSVKNWFTYPGGVWPGVEVVILLPFLIGMLLSWAAFYDAEVALAQTYLPSSANEPMSRWRYVQMQARRNAILAAPPFTLLLAQQVLVAFFPQLESSETVMAVMCGILLALLFFGQPWLLRVLLALRPLPEGPLRQQLFAMARRLDFQCSDILIWNTHNNVATALLTGPLPPLRYVVLTDLLIEHLEPEEIEAVFAHEVGHIKHHHLPFYLIFLLLSIGALTAIGHWVADWLQFDGLVQGAVDRLSWMGVTAAHFEFLILGAMLTILSAYVFFVFGLISRRCERQADAYACRMTSCQAMQLALEKVACLNGINRERPGWLSSWQHGTIAERVAFLERLQASPIHYNRFQQETRIFQWGVLLVLASIFFLLGPQRLYAVLMLL